MEHKHLLNMYDGFKRGRFNIYTNKASLFRAVVTANFQ